MTSTSERVQIIQVIWSWSCRVHVQNKAFKAVTLWAAVILPDFLCSGLPHQHRTLSSTPTPWLKTPAPSTSAGWMHDATNATPANPNNNISHAISYYGPMTTSHSKREKTTQAESRPWPWESSCPRNSCCYKFAFSQSLSTCLHPSIFDAWCSHNSVSKSRQCTCLAQASDHWIPGLRVDCTPATLWEAWWPCLQSKRNPIITRVDHTMLLQS